MKAERYHSLPIDIDTGLDTGVLDDADDPDAPVVGAAAPPRDDPDALVVGDAAGPGDAAGLREEDIQIIMWQANVNRARAIQGLRDADGDIVAAMMNLAL